MRTQFYLPRAWFSLTATPLPIGPQPPPGPPEDFGWTPGLGVLRLLGTFFLVITGKQRSMVKARRGLDEIRWDRLDWHDDLGTARRGWPRRAEGP